MEKQCTAYFISFILFITFSLMSQDKNNSAETINASPVEVIGTKETNDLKTGTVKTDPTGFTNVINAEDFKGRYASLEDVLEKEAGVRIRRYGGLGSYSTLSIRGSNANQTKIFIDGIPLNNAQGGEINLADLSFDNLEAIEVYKSGLPGNLSGTSISGAVNLVTGKGKPGQKITRFNIAGGSLHTYKVNAFRSGNTEKTAYSVFVQNEKSDQNYRFKNNNGTPVFNTLDDFDDKRRNAQFNRYNFTGNLSYDITQDTKLKILNDFTYRENGLPGPGSNQTKKTERKYLRNTVSAGTEIKSLFFRWMNLDTKVFYTGARDHLFDPEHEYSSGAPNSRAGIQQYGFHASPILYLLPYNQILRFSFMVERETFFRDKRDKFDEVISQGTRKFRHHSVASASDEIRLFDKKLVIFPFVQSEKYSDFYNESTNQNSTFLMNQDSTKEYYYNTGRLGITLTPIRNDTATFSWKSNLSSEKRNPDFSELFGERGMVIGNTSLKPEQSRNFDTGPHFDFRGKRFKSKTSFAYFQKRIKDMILFLPNSQFSLRPENIDSAEIRGVEFIQKFDIVKQIRLDSNYTFQNAINTSDIYYLKGKVLPLRPRHEWNGGIQYYNTFMETGFEASFTGAVFKDRSNEYANYQPARWIYNFHFSYFFGGRSENPEDKEISLSLEIKNILDKRVEDIVGYPLPGRLYYGKFSAKF